MRTGSYVISITILLVVVLISCKNDVTPPPPPPPEHNLNVLMNPTDAGSVSPDGGTYKEGANVSVQATPSGKWQFANWSGDISSTENPVTITMDQDYSITANFSESTEPEAFTTGITITDGVHSEKITLVSANRGIAQSELDGDDKESPPIAPPGAFFVGSVVENMNLTTDARPAAERMVWELRLNRASGETIILDSWDISNDSEGGNDLKGNLMLVDNPDDSTPNIEIDMQSNSSYTVSDPSIQRLFVVYTAPEPAKMITNFNDQKINRLNEIETGASMDDRSIKKGDIKITSDKNRN